MGQLAHRYHNPMRQLAHLYHNPTQAEQLAPIGANGKKALEAELPGRPPVPRPAPRRSLAERDQAARRILRGKYE